MFSVLIIDNSVDNTGASKAILKAIGELPAGAAKCTFVFPSGSKCIETACSLGYDSFGVPMLEISRRPGDLLRYLPRLIANTRQLKKYMKQHRIRIVQCNDVYNMLGISLKLMGGMRCISHVRRMPESFPASIYRFWVRMHERFTDIILPVSAANKRAFSDAPNVRVAYDPLPEAEQLARFVPREHLDKKVSLLYLANYTDGKGHLHALKVMQLVRQNLPDWQVSLQFYGGNFGQDKNASYRQSLEQYAKDNGLDAFVAFGGPTHEVERVMKAHDVVLNLSDSESFSRVTLEALFYGLPIVATDVGGTNEMVIEGKTGLLAPARDVAVMYQKLETLLLNDTLRTSMSAEAYTFVRRQFGWEHSIGPILRSYEELSVK